MIIKFLKQNGWAMYLGAALVIIGGINGLEWKVWAIIPPTIILVTWKDW